MRKEVAFAQPRSSQLCWKPPGARVPVRVLTHVSGAMPPSASAPSAGPPFSLGRSKKRTACAQSEGCCLGESVPSFPRGKELKSPEKEGEKQGRWGGDRGDGRCAAALLRVFPRPAGTVSARLCRSPCTAAPHPGRGLLLLGKTELAGEDVGLNMSYGAGAEGSGSFRSLLLGLARHAGVSGRPGGSPGARVTGERAPLPAK